MSHILSNNIVLAYIEITSKTHPGGVKTTQHLYPFVHEKIY